LHGVDGHVAQRRQIVRPVGVLPRSSLRPVSQRQKAAMNLLLRLGKLASDVGAAKYAGFGFDNLATSAQIIEIRFSLVKVRSSAEIGVGHS
jgi:hypothetical protein